MIAEVLLCCGRNVLYVAGLAVAMEGDKCRDGHIPEEFIPEIPKEELENSYIGGKKSIGITN